MNGELVGFGKCFVHQGTFAFDPDTVTSVLIDPVTGLSPDLGGDPVRAQREPVCPDCCAAVNPVRAQRGLELLDERDSLDRHER